MQEKVKAFYNDFMKSRMLNYRLHGNLRLEIASLKILSEIKKTDNVLDIGCGIGIITEQVAKLAKNGQVVGVDISEQNIWYAQQTIKKANLSFLVADIIEQESSIAQHVGNKKFDVVIMVDVIEHIPEDDRPKLFEIIRKLSSNDALLILTYPSPQYQRYLIEHNPGELQIIDNLIELDTLLDEIHNANYSLKYYSLETVWKKNQYVHCILQTDAALTPKQEQKRSPYNLLIRKLDQRLFLPIRKRKYLIKVFEKK